MATILCLTIVAAIAAPKVQGYFLQARLGYAKPYLAEIAEKQRQYRIITGQYCCTGYNGTDENALSNALGVSLTNAGDFCFEFICNSTSVCASNPNTTSFIVPPDPGTATPDFEVWAVLRPPSGAGGVQGPGGANCTPAPSKATPTGWTNASTATSSAGRAGEVVVLRYPPPANGTSASPGTYHAVPFTWTLGFSLSDAMVP